jgi:lauroyl/myristoyl acyltransferase
VPLQINAALERVIANSPAQYLWSYNRYKIPRGVMPPAAEQGQGQDHDQGRGKPC